MDRPAANERPVHELIRARWSPRAFSAKPVSRETLASLFEAARWSASSYNEQPWRFIVATREDPRAFETMVGCLAAPNQVWAKGAPVLAILVKKHGFTYNGKPNRVALYDCGAAAAQLTFEATARGLVVHQMAGIDQEKCRATYAIPAEYEAATGIAIGYTGEASSLPDDLRKMETEPRERKPLKEIVFGGKFGEPSAIVG